MNGRGDLACAAIRGFIFDLDGVLIDSVAAHVEAWSRTLHEFGYPFTAEVYERKLDGRRRVDALRSVMTDADPQRIALASAAKEQYYIEGMTNGLLYHAFDSSRRFIRHWRAKGVRMAAASSSTDVRATLKKTGLLDSIDVVIGGDDVEVGKPHPETFLRAARDLHLSVGECLVFEDAEAGVQAAKSGGFFCVGIHRHGDITRLAGADLIVSDLDELDDVAISRLDHAMAQVRQSSE